MTKRTHSGHQVEHSENDCEIRKRNRDRDGDTRASSKGAVGQGNFSAPRCPKSKGSAEGGGGRHTLLHMLLGIRRTLHRIGCVQCATWGVGTGKRNRRGDAKCIRCLLHLRLQLHLDLVWLLDICSQQVQCEHFLSNFDNSCTEPKLCLLCSLADECKI